MRTTLLRSVALSSILVVLGACGGGGDDGDVTTDGTADTGGNSGGGDADLTAFQDCLAEQGIDLGDFGGPPEGGQGEGTPPSFDPEAPPGSFPGGGEGGGFPGGGLPEGVDQEAFQAAIEACGDLAPEGGFGAGGPGGGGLEALDAFLSCLADNGVESAEDTGEETTPPSIDETDPEYAAAQETCAPLLPQPGAEGSSTTVPAEEG